MVKFRAPTQDDIIRIGENMRAADVAEVWAAGRRGPCEALYRSMRASNECVTIDIEDEPIAMMGVAKRSLLSDEGYIWLLGTNGVAKHYRKLAPTIPPTLAAMGKHCKVLRNYVHERNTLSIRWLRRMGFTLDEPAPYGAIGDSFHHFYRET